MGARLAHRTLLVLFFAALFAAPATANPPTVLYSLDGDYAFQEGCFGECMCPVLVAEMTGTFGLTAGPPSGGFATWILSDVDWEVPSLGQHLTGSGVFLLSPGSDAQQQLILDLSLNGRPVERYDSGVVPAVSALPRIDGVVSLYGLQCWDRVLAVHAAPAGPVTFRFEAQVGSVFDGLGALGNSVAPGDAFHGSFTFDTRTPNTAPPIDEGEAGFYHHDRPPAGVRVRLGHFTFRSVPAHPDFDVIVNNEFGFAGADEFGFASHNNQARGLLTAAPIGRLDLHWLASTITNDPLRSAELPRRPPDLEELGGGTLIIEGECTLCLGPAAFFRIEATLTSLTRPVRVSVDRDFLWWDGPADAAGYDIIHGDVGALASGFAAATEGCLASDHPGDGLGHGATPALGQAFWFAVRDDERSWDSFGLAQEGGRDEGVSASAAACP